MATATWTGAADTADLSDPRNWSGGSVPGAADTAVFNGGTLTVSNFPLPASATLAPFTPGAVSVGGAADVTFGPGEDPATFDLPTLDIAGNSTVAFVGTNLIAGTVLDQGVLDVSQAFMFGDEPKQPISQSNAVAWSIAHGFGSVALVAVVEQIFYGPTGTYVTPPGTGPTPTYVEGSIDFGANNIAAERVARGGPGDLPSTMPAYSGTGGIWDAVQPTDRWAPGFSSTPSPYPALVDEAVPCFCAGTPILTERGKVPVEALRPGHRVRTRDRHRVPVRWIGQRRVPAAVIRFAANALARGAPEIPVWLSPDHAVLVDGVLIPAHLLVNGLSITREPPAAVTLVHIELDRHAILLAAGLPAESYLDTGNRGQFDRECGVRPLFPPPAGLQATVHAYAVRGCAPFCLDGERVRVAHARLLTRAQTMGSDLLPGGGADRVAV
jgi:hypothetical protein